MVKGDDFMNEKLVNAVNEQLNFEIESAHIYLAMAGYISTLGLEGFENWMMVQYEEELAHTKKFMLILVKEELESMLKGSRIQKITSNHY